MSRLTGPPIDSLMSKFLSILFGVASPASFNSCVKLSPCIDWVEKVTNVELVNVLPPSFGMKLIRTPPVDMSADSDEVSIVISAAEPTSGCCPPMLPPACRVMMLTPLSVIRWSTLLLP